MKKNHKNKKLLFSIALSLLLFTNMPCLAEAATPAESPVSVTALAKGSGIVPYADNIKWVYKTVGNHIYRRQYNYTKNVWIGDWELCV